ncbi:hypothetical protein FSB65_30290 [Paraburkholderia sp. JPY418]|nr:hypothetical protein [Paraburkholderia youngii]
MPTRTHRRRPAAQPGGSRCLALCGRRTGRLHFRETVPLREIARRTALSRNTIRKWLRQPEAAEPEDPPKLAVADRTSPGRLGPRCLQAPMRQKPVLRSLPPTCLIPLHTTVSAADGTSLYTVLLRPLR